MGHTRAMDSPEANPTAAAEASENGRRSVRKRARTLLTVDETVERIGSTTADLAEALTEFNASLARFNHSLDRFAEAADALNGVSGRLDAIVDRMEPLLAVVTAPIELPGRIVKKVTGRD